VYQSREAHLEANFVCKGLQGEAFVRSISPEQRDMQQKSKIKSFPYKISADVTFNPDFFLVL